MKKIIAGSLAILLGVFGLAAAFPSFLTLITGIIPFMLIVGGGLAIYLNYEGNSQNCSTATDCLDNSCDTAIPSHEKPEQNIVDTAKDNSGQLLGNTESRVFHNPDCKFSKSKNCTAVFKTNKEAIQDGYKPCGICKP